MKETVKLTPREFVRVALAIGFDKARRVIRIQCRPTWQEIALEAENMAGDLLCSDENVSKHAKLLSYSQAADTIAQGGKL